MKQFDDELNMFEQANPLSLFYEFGSKPEDVKSGIIDTFSPFFHNQENLKSYAISDLVGVWLGFLLARRDCENAEEYLKAILSVFNNAKVKNADITAQAYAQWLPEISHSISRFWSLYKSQKKPAELGLEDFAEDALNTIGKCIEGLSKPFLKLLLHLKRIGQGQIASLEELQAKDLGSVIDELTQHEVLRDLLDCGFASVRLNQWRNIAYHHNSKVVKGQIVCWYKTRTDVQEFTITREELYRVTKRVFLVYKLVRIAQNIYCVDNIDTISVHGEKLKEDELTTREESGLLDFYSAIES